MTRDERIKAIRERCRLMLEVYAPADITWLLTEIDRLTKERDELAKEVERLKEYEFMYKGLEK